MAKVLKRRQPKAKTVRRRVSAPSLGKPKVFVVHKGDIMESKHRLLWAKDGDLNAAEGRGNVRRFTNWTVAKAAAAAKARQIGATKAKHKTLDAVSYHG